MKYLNNIRTLEQLKKEYHAWALKLHPDHGGDLEAMKVLNNEYDVLFARVKDFHTNKGGEIYEKKTDESPAEFKEIIEKLLKLPEIKITVIGSFIWVEGNTRPVKDELKSMGFRFHAQKLNWYKAPAGYRKHNGNKYSMDEIKNMFGVQYESESEARKRLTA